ncbi:MAG: hypothetical protein ABIE03_00140 [Patescibacteria group bacterium]|nr:hypothetical protein [Patescibacteria group bacterium]
MKLHEYKIVDIHGSNLLYSESQRDIYYKDNIIAVGDAISCVNPLGGEGIRHAMHSADIVSRFIVIYLDTQEYLFEDYEKEMRKYFGKKWLISEKLRKIVYGQLNNEMIEKGFNYATGFSTNELMDLLFFYKFDRIDNALNNFILNKLKRLFS